MPAHSAPWNDESWYPYDHPALSRIETHSSTASDATAPNLTGAGRTVGILLYALGARFETFLNERAARLGGQSDHIALTRVDTRSTVATNATAPNLTGAGRVLGLLLYALGARFETFLSRRAIRLRLDPEGVAQKIRRLRRHDEVSFLQRHTSPNEPISEREKKSLRKLCKKLLKYSK